MTTSFLAHMTITLEDGSVADSTKANGQPAKLTIGDDSLSPAFEACLGDNIAAGQTHEFTLAPKDAFGDKNPDNLHYIDRTKFANDSDLEVGAIIAFDGPAGEIPGIIREVAGDSVTVDFNHPLAGHAVTFEIEVLEVL
ncbi:FKBP-type peptidyl-prolyl cis-trans isomerase [Paraferrimonas sp. SM1919]|uniref:FKBP-type peptidyl-prolyl cis-trans isomerase n=1 Tax=Paraferrimonas sp. SM1919 TaxID=2662263 RepID=UPI0013D07B0B|nr:FKBP-type peptidyl-prolyl cis-trans isomerase [Paraferrimonas sp. SM1919]